MSEKLGPVYLDGDQEVFVGMEFGQSRGYSEEMAARIDAEVKRLLEECYQKAVDALSANRDRMEKLVDALLKYDTISRREFVTLMETGALPGYSGCRHPHHGRCDDAGYGGRKEERKFRKVRRNA